MARQNLVTNPSFTNNANGWVGLNGASIEHFDFGTRPCVRVTKTAYTGQGLVSANYITVLPEKSYAYSAYIYIPTALTGGENAPFVVAVTWYNSSNTELATTTSDATDVAIGDGWVRLTQVSTSPTGAVKAKMKVYQTTTATNAKRFLVDSIMLEQSEYVGAFVDVLSQDQETEKVNRALSVYRDLNYITGLQLNADVQLGDLVFNTIDEDDIVWICTDIQGWWTTADPEVPSIPRGFEDGSYDVSGRYAARELTLTGVFIPQRPSDVGLATSKLLEAVDLVRQGAWLRTSEEPTKASFVRLVSRPQIQTVNARGRTEFSIGLRAGDPIKYKWDDTKVDGITTQSVDLSNEAPNDFVEFTVQNEGNAVVTAKLVFTGPLGAGSTVSVYHEDDGTTETMTLIEPLRADGPVATITDIEITNNIVLITTQEQHGLSIGEIVSITGTASSVVNTSGATITSVTDTLPYTLSFTLPGSNNDLEKTESEGAVSLVSADEMIVDTYNRNVTVNGDATGYRSKLDTLTDWITFRPGANTVTFTDSIDTVNVSTKSYGASSNVVTLKTTESHFLKVTDKVTIELPVTAEIAFKEFSSGTVTITTALPHGFSVGDLVDVKTTLSTTITNKEIATNVATLTVADSTAVSDNDVVLIAMPATAQIISKQRIGDVVTLTTSNSTTGHGFSNGDSVTIPFSIDAYVATKSLTGNVATITTTTAHNFSQGDQVLIELPETTTVNQKTIAGTQVTLATTTAHGFSEGDRITVALPTSATLSSSRKFGGAAFFNVTFRESSGTTRTLTTSVAHGFTNGDTVLVANVGSNYNGTYTITGTPTTTTFTYTGTGSVSESPAVAAEGSVTNTSMSYLVTLNTTTNPHNFAVGDSITVDIGITSTATVTNREATSTQCILTTTATHKYAVGEVITVSGISARYDGTHTITGVTTDTITYDFAGTTESSTGSSGSISNLTIANGYNGTKVITSTTATSLTYVYYGQESYTLNNNAGTSPTLTNNTNTAINGTNLVLTSASGTTLQYTRTV